MDFLVAFERVASESGKERVGGRRAVPRPDRLAMAVGPTATAAMPTSATARVAPPAAVVTATSSARGTARAISAARIMGAISATTRIAPAVSSGRPAVGAGRDHRLSHIQRRPGFTARGAVAGVARIVPGSGVVVTARARPAHRGLRSLMGAKRLPATRTFS